MRREVPLLRLGSSEAILRAVTFLGAGPDAVPGLVVMLIDDAASYAEEIDPHHSAAVVALNFACADAELVIEKAIGRDFALAPSLGLSVDLGVQGVRWSRHDGVLSIPALTAAVLVERRD